MALKLALAIAFSGLAVSSASAAGKCVGKDPLQTPRCSRYNNFQLGCEADPVCTWRAMNFLSKLPVAPKFQTQK